VFFALMEACPFNGLDRPAKVPASLLPDTRIFSAQM